MFSNFSLSNNPMRRQAVSVFPVTDGETEALGDPVVPSGQYVGESEFEPRSV